MFLRLFLIAALVLPCVNASEQAEIDAKYAHAQAVVKAWTKWQERLYERSTLLEVNAIRRSKRAAAEREAFAAMFDAIDRLRKAGSVMGTPRANNSQDNSGEVEAAKAKDTPKCQ
jgi:hypothetical protein